MNIARTSKNPILTTRKDVFINKSMLTRHGLIVGATGRGKTISARVLAENLSKENIPVFLTDIKGDLAGICKEGEETPKIRAAIDSLEIKNFKFSGFPVKFWDVLGQQGAPIKTTVQHMGSLFLGKMLDLTEAQNRLINAVFQFAEDNNNTKLHTLTDLSVIVSYLGRLRSPKYGNISPASASVIMGRVLELQRAGGDNFFGDDKFSLVDFMKTERGKGKINILAANKLFRFPKLYAGFLLWILDSIFETFPEVGDLEKPKLVIIIDEAHLLFKKLSHPLMERIEESIKLIRSKGVGVFFSTQDASDIPKSILGQLGNRIQHAINVLTPDAARNIKNMSATFAENPMVNVEDSMKNMETGEALVAFLNERGSPMPVERCSILPPQSFLGGITQEERENFY